MEIRCRKTDCHFNNGCSCNAKKINIYRCGTCGSYECDEEKKEKIKNNPNFFEFAEELTPANTNNVPLTCKAAICLFNHTGICRANGISIVDDDGHNLAECATFIER
jgi:hypothetical protein